MRRAFADTLVDVGIENDRLIFLTGDLGYQVFDAFQTRFPARYINVGIAEAQMVCAAAGMALEGARPICYSIASFMTGRAYEQIRVSVCYPRLPVLIVGAGGGYTYASSGVTHHAADDLALMSALPGMTVVAPGDPGEVTQLLPQLCRLPGPAYLRIGRFGEEVYQAEQPAIVGQARLLRAGERVGIVTTGDVTPGVVRAVQTLHGEGIFPAALQMHTVKPLDTVALDRLAERVETLVVVEEATPTGGGLYTAVCQWHASCTRPPRLKRLGPPDELALGNCKRETLRRRWNYDADAVASTVRALWSARPALHRVAA
jgi:transketolase